MKFETGGRPTVTPATEALMIAKARKPILFRASVDPVLKHYAWGGGDLARWLKRPQERIAEIWFCSTQSDGVSSIDGMPLISIVAANPADMLGPGFIMKPTFSKVLGKDQNQPQIVQIGFTERIVGRKQEFISRMQEERQIVVQLKDELNRILASIEDETARRDAFEEYRKGYEGWVSGEIAAGWTLGCGPDFSGTRINAVMQDSGFDTAIFGRLADTRRELTGYLNTIELQVGRTIISPVGYIHSIVGSHQTHPLVNEPKTEAWYIFSGGKNEAGKDILFYFEPQQTSNTTYSLFDFPTPLVYTNAGVEMRKDLTRGLDAILNAGEEPPRDDLAAIRCIAERTVRFEPTKPEDFIVSGRARDVRDEYLAVCARVERVVEGSYPVIDTMPFVLDIMVLNGSVETPAEVTIVPLDHSYSDLVILEGKVTILIDDRREACAAGDAVFFPASDRTPRTIVSSRHALLARSYPPRNCT
jgi:hypothetical protein